jgi:DNA ligase-1
MEFDGALDGELLVGHAEEGGIRTGTFSDLQQRLNRKTVPAKLQKQYPAILRAYDLLQEGGEDLRPLPFEARRARLERFVEALPVGRFDLSPLVPFESWDEIAKKRNAPPDPVIEGLMLKRRDSAYVPGRPKGPWFKWKRDPFLVDAVLMYAQRGHGRRSSFYSDYTFGVWTGPADDSVLVPVGKAYFGFTDEELKQIDKYVRDNTSSASARCARCAPSRTTASSLKSPSRASTARPATSPASPCASRASRACAGTSLRTRPTGWRRWRRCWINASARPALAPAPIST